MWSWKRLCLLGLSSLLCLSAAAQLKIADDEIRMTSRPFTPQETPTLRVQTNMVQVGVVVRDARGKPVDGLKQADFEVLDAGKPQAISLFSVEHAPARVAAKPKVESSDDIPTGKAEAVPKPPPRYVALFFDDQHLAVTDLSPVQKAAEKLVREGLRPGDRIAVFTSSRTVTLEFTSETDKVFAAIASIRSQLKKAQGGTSCPRMGIYQAYLVSEHTDPDAIELARQMGVFQGCLRNMRLPEQVATVRNEARTVMEYSDGFSQVSLRHISEVIEYLAHFPGRKTLVLTSSGFFTQSLGAQQDKVLNSALRANVVINSLDAKGLYAESPGGDPADGPPIIVPPTALRNPNNPGPPDLNSYADSLSHQQKVIMQDPMAVLSEGTGGRFFHNNNDMDRGVDEVISAPEVAYNLGFSPAGLKLDGKFHELKVKLATKQEHTVEARKGYFAPTKEEQTVQDTPYQRSDRLNREVLANDTLNEIPAEATTQIEKSQDGDPVLKISVHVDVSKLPFEKRNDRSVERLVLVTALFDSSGHFLAGSEALIDLSLKAETLAYLTDKGMDAKASLQAPPGTYRLREVLEEMGGGKLAALSLPIQIK